MDQVLLSIETPNAPPMTYMVPSGGEISIGRDETCTVVLASPDISRRHVTINIHPSNIVVRDSSSNGTQVGTQRVFRSELPVPFGTPVQVGPYVIRVIRQGPNGAAAAGPPGVPQIPPVPGRPSNPLAQTMAALVRGLRLILAGCVLLVTAPVLLLLLIPEVLAGTKSSRTVFSTKSNNNSEV